MKIIILHGTGGTPDHNWFAWLGEEFSNRGWQVWVPALPHADRPNGKEWVDFIRSNAPFPLDGETVLVGHSAGAVVALQVAQTAAQPLKAVFAVAAFPDNKFLNWPALNDLFDLPFDFSAIQRGTHYLAFVHSDDDPYCPLAQTRALCERVGGELFIVPGQGHFNLEQGQKYRQFPWLLDTILAKVGV